MIVAIGLFCIFHFVVYVSCEASQIDKDLAVQRAKNLNNLPRSVFFTNGFSLDSGETTFCGGNAQDIESCEWDRYAESVLLTAGLAIVASIAAVVCVCPGFFICRFCGYCGNNERTYGFCGTGEKREDIDGKNE